MADRWRHHDWRSEKGEGLKQDTPASSSTTHRDRQLQRPQPTGEGKQDRSSFHAASDNSSRSSSGTDGDTVGQLQNCRSWQEERQFTLPALFCIPSDGEGCQPSHWCAGNYTSSPSRTQMSGYENHSEHRYYQRAHQGERLVRSGPTERSSYPDRHIPTHGGGGAYFYGVSPPTSCEPPSCLYYGYGGGRGVTPPLQPPPLLPPSSYYAHRYVLSQPCSPPRARRGGHQSHQQRAQHHSYHRGQLYPAASSFSQRRPPGVTAGCSSSSLSAQQRLFRSHSLGVEHDRRGGDDGCVIGTIMGNGSLGGSNLDFHRSHSLGSRNENLTTERGSGRGSGENEDGTHTRRCSNLSVLLDQQERREREANEKRIYERKGGCSGESTTDDNASRNNRNSDQQPSLSSDRSEMEHMLSASSAGAAAGAAEHNDRNREEQDEEKGVRRPRSASATYQEDVSKSPVGPRKSILKKQSSVPEQASFERASFVESSSQSGCLAAAKDESGSEDNEYLLQPTLRNPRRPPPLQPRPSPSSSSMEISPNALRTSATAPLASDEDGMMPIPSALRSAPLQYAPSITATSPPRSIPSVSRRSSAGDMTGRLLGEGGIPRFLNDDCECNNSVRRCASSTACRELGNVTPLAGSPYSFMLYQKGIIEATMNQRLMALRQASFRSNPSPPPSSSNDGMTSQKQQDGQRQQQQQQEEPRPCRLTNETRNRRRAEHHQAVIDDLCEIVTDMFMAESKLLNPSSYGVGGHTSPRDEVYATVQQFLSDLPSRYALGVETPSEVLVHMRLMAAARADTERAAVHIVNIERRGVDDIGRGRNAGSRDGRGRLERMLRLVTISCSDHNGLLEYITKLLGTGGSRVVDADVMLSKDNIALDRFVVEMNGRLRLDKLQQYIEAYLRQAKLVEVGAGAERTTSPLEECDPSKSSPVASSITRTEGGNSVRSRGPAYGPLYFHPSNQGADSARIRIQEEMQSAIPLSEVIACNSNVGHINSGRISLGATGFFSNHHPSSHMETSTTEESGTTNPHTNGSGDEATPASSGLQTTGERGSEGRYTPPNRLSPRSQVNGNFLERDNNAADRRRILVNREATYLSGLSEDSISSRTCSDWGVDSSHIAPPAPPLLTAEQRVVPVIPSEELMLIETLGSGRVSTIYRAIWRRAAASSPPSVGGEDAISMVALKVATVPLDTGDTSHVEELHREADIAAMLRHKNVCELVGVASDASSFCLAYEYCEGGSLLSLLSDSTRYYEYLPIALDIASGMAYLHSRNVIHRDLKPSNILLTKDNRAKIADFGISVANTGQELTAETGTYRWMAPEVIRHESYSSNADVYSFGIVLWQLITREVPFATMTPVQAAYAVAEGQRPEIPPSTPERLREIICACWNEDSHKRPSFTYIAMALADYAKMAFSPANVGAQTVQIANEMLATVQGNSTVNVDFSAPMAAPRHRKQPSLPNMNLGDRARSDSFPRSHWFFSQGPGSFSNSGNVGLEI